MCPPEPSQLSVGLSLSDCRNERAYRRSITGPGVGDWTWSGVHRSKTVPKLAGLFQNSLSFADRFIFSSALALRLQRRRLGPIDLALLPIGAYEPRWFMKSAHMNPAEAVQAHLDLEASESIGMHFGAFPMTTEGIDEPVRALAEARAARNILPQRFRTLEFGESMRLE